MLFYSLLTMSRYHISLNRIAILVFVEQKKPRSQAVKS